MEGATRTEFLGHRPRQLLRCRRRSIAVRTLSIGCLFHFLSFLLGTLSDGIIMCSAFPLKKSGIEETTVKTKTATGSTSPMISTSPPPSCVGRLSILNNKILKNTADKDATTTINYYVIGTSHFRCDSYKEVSDLICRVNPDGVVIELDPERLLRLTLDDASVRVAAAETTGAGAMEMIGKRWFGGDFLSAIETSKELDIPIFLGDEYPLETKQRFIDTVLDANSYNPTNILKALQSLFRTRLDRTTNSNSKVLSINVDVVGTFLDDPRKLLPLVATLSVPCLILIFAIALDTTSVFPTNVSPHDGAMLDSFFQMLATLLSLVLSFFASCKVFNNLIADRDAVIASNIQNAVTTLFMLKSKQLIRKRWTFPATEMEDECAHKEAPGNPNKLASSGIPLFTLKNALEQDAVRNLNLFEPRWLKMIDRLLLSNQKQKLTTNRVAVDPATKDASASGEQRIIGCVTCRNKFYSAINVAEASRGFVEGRYADVIFRRRGRFGHLINVTEGSRPSGARKVRAEILGKETFDLSSPTDDGNADEISVTPEGYLTASNLVPIDENESTTSTMVKDVPNELNIIVVVGLLHANGVLENLSKNASKCQSKIER